MSTERGAANYQKNKSRKRERPHLDRPQLRQFLELCSRAVGTGEFEIHLGLGRQDVEWLKNRLGIEEPMDARRYLQDFEGDDRLEEMLKDNQRDLARRKRNEAQARLENREAQQAAEQRRRQQAVKELTDPTAIKKEDAERQRRFAASERADGNKKANSVHHVPSAYYDGDTEQATEKERPSWELPESVDPDMFRVWITSYGLRFVRDRFSISNADIRREVKRLGLKINWDTVRN